MVGRAGLGSALWCWVGGVIKRESTPGERDTKMAGSCRRYVGTPR